MASHRGALTSLTVFMGIASYCRPDVVVGLAGIIGLAIHHSFRLILIAGTDGDVWQCVSDGHGLWRHLFMNSVAA